MKATNTRKPVKTENQIKAEKEARRISNLPVKLMTQVRSNCEKFGLRKMELELDFLIEFPETKLLPIPELDYETTVKCFRQGIEYYKHALKNPHEKKERIRKDKESNAA